MGVRLTVAVSDKARIVRQGMQNLRREIPQIGAQKMYDALSRAKARITRYPAIPAGSTYQRSGTFGHGWQIIRLTGGDRQGWRLHGEARDRRGRDYTHWVSGSAYGTMQARVHAGRWVKVRDAVDDEVRKLPAAIREELAIVARREFGGGA